MALDIHVAEHVAELVIDNPPVNALDSAGWHEFACAIREIALELGLLAAAEPIAAVPTEGYPLPATRPAFSALDAAETSRRLDLPLDPSASLPSIQILRMGRSTSSTRSTE